MALSVTNNFKLPGGIEISTLYIRLLVGMIPNGKKLRIKLLCYINKEKYNEDNLLPFNINIDNIIDYNREVDGVDVLTLAHNYVKSKILEKYPSAVVDIVDF